MTHLHKYKDDFVLLLESGFIAASQTDEDAALKLFRAARILKPNNQLPKVGFGYIHLLKLELQQACKMFEEVLRIDSSNDMARALLGLSTAFTIKEVEKGEKLLEETLKKTKDQSVKEMATTAIEFIEKYIKKEPTPVQGPPKTHSKKKGK